MGAPAGIRPAWRVRRRLSREVRRRGEWPLPGPWTGRARPYV